MPTVDVKAKSQVHGNVAPIEGALAANLHVSDALTSGPTRALWVGGAGNITCRLLGDTADVVFVGVAAGTIIPARVTHIRATTTASSILALY